MVDLLGIRIPRKKVCPNHVAPFTAFADAFFARSSVSVWLASRGFGGKSYLLATLAFTEAVTLEASVSVLGGSGDQSKRVNKYINDFWLKPTAPSHMLASDPSHRQVTLTAGNTIEALMASQASVRGGHPQRLRLDEVDVMKLDIMDAAFGQPMGKPGISMQTVISSTHQNPQGTMTEVLERAEKKRWPIYRWCYRETSLPHGWLNPNDVSQKQTDVTDNMWKIEYDLNAPKPEDVAIMTARVEQMFDPRLGDYIGGVGEDIIIEEYDPNGTYVTGIDWAKKRDWTVIWTMRTDVAPNRLVAFLRIARTDWPVMQSAADRRIKQYPGQAFYDETGIGDVVGDNLTVDAEGLILSGRVRSDLLNNYVRAVEAGKIVAPMIQWVYNEHKYATIDDLYGSGHLPDSICAGALAWYASNNEGWVA